VKRGQSVSNRDKLAVGPMEYQFNKAARLPCGADNCAVGLVRLEPGEAVLMGRNRIRIRSAILEGHRFAVRRIDAGSPLTSWGRPFGIALRTIASGESLCNAELLEELGHRVLDFKIPDAPNFANYTPTVPVIRNDQAVRIRNVPGDDQRAFFNGFYRSDERGAGTRNVILVLGASSRVSGFVRRLTERANRLPGHSSGRLDGIAAVTHTEGGANSVPNNLTYVLRTLAGFMVHPNVGAVLAADTGKEPVNNHLLRRFLEKHRYPIQQVPHSFITLTNDFEACLRQGVERIASWIDRVATHPRIPIPVSGLRIALQCGGSDSFSGITANPLVGEISRRILACGGSANLAETDELVGAEEYILSPAGNAETAARFLEFIEEFSERMRRHGHSPEGNPSGGNRFRGLYNIVLKSLGAAMKKHPDVALDYVVDYAERMSRPGFYFMNSPGNDLESIAGQVASGANLIFFTTGNGSVTNFPFVPTLKVISTTSRFQAQEADMDINAGRILEGTTIPELAAEVFDLALEVASGQQTKGEAAGHSQVSIWRDWAQSGSLPRKDSVAAGGPPPEIRIETREFSEGDRFESTWSSLRRVPDRIGLILPNSLCSAQVAVQLAERLQRDPAFSDSPITRFVALPHTEGCGVSGGPSQDLFERHLFGYLRHPAVARALLLEHGCEKVHHECLRKRMVALGIDPDQFGWASIQGDGGTAGAINRARNWFLHAAVDIDSPAIIPFGPGRPRIGIALDLAPDGGVESLVSLLASRLICLGCTIILACGFPTATTVVEDKTALATGRLATGEIPPDPGFWVMDAASDHPVETLTSLGSTGADLLLVLTSDPLSQGHLFIPSLIIRATDTGEPSTLPIPDLRLSGVPDADCTRILESAAAVLQRSYLPGCQKVGNVDFQIPRGPHGVSV